MQRPSLVKYMEVLSSYNVARQDRKETKKWPSAQCRRPFTRSKYPVKSAHLQNARAVPHALSPHTEAVQHG